MKAKAKRMIGLALVLAMTFALLPAQAVRTNEVAYQPPRGINDIVTLIDKLPVVATTMLIGAHPDDESNANLAYAYRGLKTSTSYLVANWGEGGDNVIGTERYEALGVLRSQELASARSIDGGKQLHFDWINPDTKLMNPGRFIGYDFGYSVNLFETSGIKADRADLASYIVEDDTYIYYGAYKVDKDTNIAYANVDPSASTEDPDAEFTIPWDVDLIVANAVWHIRKERPDMIWASHGLGTGGHGQHQTMAVVTELAVRNAANPLYHPEDVYAAKGLGDKSDIEALPAWTVTALLGAKPGYDSYPYSGDSAIPMTLYTGRYDPAIGMSASQLGGLSRSMHKCQKMANRGTPDYGTSTLYVRWLADPAQVITSDDPMQLFDSSLSRIPNTVTSAPELKTALEGIVSDLEDVIDTVKADYEPLDTRSAGEAAIEGLRLVDSAIAAVQGDNEIDGLERDDVLGLLGNKRVDFENVANAIFAIGFDVTSDEADGKVVPGQAFSITPRFYNRGEMDVANVSFAVEAEAGWSVGAIKAPAEVPAGGKDSGSKIAVTAGGSNWTDAFSALPLTVTATWEYNGVSVPVRFSPDIFLVPAVTVNVQPESSLIKKGETAAQLTALVVNNSKSAQSGKVSIAPLPDGWEVAGGNGKAFSIAAENATQMLVFDLNVPADAAAQKYSLPFVASVGAERYTNGYQSVSYPHINPKLLFKDSAAGIVVADLKVADGLRVGFLDSGMENSWDYVKMMVPGAVKITAADLNDPNLIRKYDTIVFGTKVWNNAALGDAVNAAKANVMEYVRQGGNLIIQYVNNWPNYTPDEFTPFTFSGNVNINDENSIVTHNPKVAEDPVFQHLLGGNGNVIGEEDWAGWFQQRAEWTPAVTLDAATGLASGYLPVMWAKDPGGADRYPWLVRQYGEGTWQYTSITWNLEFDNLVPGAYRMFANMMSLPLNAK